LVLKFSCVSHTFGFVQIKTYRERARALFPHIKKPEILCPITIHPAFEKAGHYFDVKVVHAPVDDKTKKVDVAALEALISPNTIAICVSAPQYCHCIIDPIEDVAKVALRHSKPATCFSAAPQTAADASRVVYWGAIRSASARRCLLRWLHLAVD